MSAIYETCARAVGGRDGHAETPDGLLKVDLAMPPELGGKGNGTNPEQLFAAGYAACFESAMRYVARQKKLGLKNASVTATVQLHPRDGGGFKLAVKLDAEVEGLDEAAARGLVETAHQVCPYSNAVRGNIDVELTTAVL
ncbi:MAG: organic hydroperoxide resistance protein [Phenylobacterium sp.]|uniref:organic hydroperoxide resistance protein n=1 Tax=Phenylobacterium sp. TaxID=1871053 RepID=UPI00391A6329